MTQKKTISPQNSRSSSPTDQTSVGTILLEMPSYNYKQVLQRFSTRNPNDSGLQSKLNSNNPIIILTDYFANNPEKNITRLLQIIMLLRYIHRHEKSYSDEVSQLESLLHGIKFNFKDLINYINSKASENIFYADVIDVIKDSFEFLKSTELSHLSEFLKGSTTELAKNVDPTICPITELDLLDDCFEEFVMNAFQGFESICNQKFDAVAIHRNVKLMLNFPFTSFVSENKLQDWYDTLTILATRSDDLDFQQYFINTMSNWLSDSNINLYIENKLKLLTSLNKHLSMEMRLKLAHELAKTQTANISSELFKFNLIPNLHQHFEKQCNNFLGRANKSVLITPRKMQEILCNHDVYGSKILTDIACENACHSDTSEVSLLELDKHVFIKRIQNSESPANYSSYHYSAAYKNATANDIERAIQGMINLVYFEQPWFKDAPKTLSFKIVFESTDGSTNDFYCSLSYSSLGQYHWMDPYLISQPISFTRQDSDSMAKYIYAQAVKPNTARFVVTQYNNAPKPVLFAKPAARRSGSPELEMSNAKQKTFDALPRNKSEPSMNSLKA